jgi:hypothetical protein
MAQQGREASPNGLQQRSPSLGEGEEGSIIVRQVRQPPEVKHRIHFNVATPEGANLLQCQSGDGYICSNTSLTQKPLEDAHLKRTKF